MLFERVLGNEAASGIPVYNDVVGLRVADGKVSAAAILPMRTFAFAEQKVSIDGLKRKPWVFDFGYELLLSLYHRSERSLDMGQKTS